MDGSNGLLAGSWGPKGGPSSGQGTQPPPPLLNGDAAAASTAAKSGDEEEGELCNTSFRSGFISFCYQTSLLQIA